MANSKQCCGTSIQCKGSSNHSLHYFPQDVPLCSVSAGNICLYGLGLLPAGVGSERKRKKLLVWMCISLIVQIEVFKRVHMCVLLIIQGQNWNRPELRKSSLCWKFHYRQPQWISWYDSKNNILPSAAQTNKRKERPAILVSHTFNIST